MSFLSYNAPRYLALALSPHERRMLWGGGVFKFREGACPAKNYGGRNRRCKPGPRYGLLVRLARAWLDGKCQGKRICELAREHQVKEDSLRATIQTQKKRRQEAQGRAA